MSEPKKDTLINAHAHVFTHHAVPPFIARTVIPWPFYFLIHLPTVMRIFKWAKKRKSNSIYNPQSRRNRWRRFRTRFNILLRNNILIRLIWTLIGVWLTMQAVFFLVCYVVGKTKPDEIMVPFNYLLEARDWLQEHHVLYQTHWFIQWLIILLVVLFFKSGRNLLFFLGKQAFAFLRKLPGKNTLELAERYVQMGNFAQHDQQRFIFKQLKYQYEPGTQFVALPMDMKYMGAGKISKIELEGGESVEQYFWQMHELARINEKEGDILHPFVFIDPRRIKDDGPAFFDYTFDNGKVTLAENCFVRQYIECEQFSGFKIYPALGYFPFDEKLLPLWKYAADNKLPIMTHCVKGVIYYRGKKKNEWDTHPVFKETRGNLNYQPLILHAKKNIDFQSDFTHPLNYLCLLSEPLLRQLVGKAKDQKVRDLFGYNGPDQPMDHNLEHLKVCLAHYGGEPEWERYAEKDRDGKSLALIADRERGIDLRGIAELDNPDHVYQQLWKSTDWYSLICSLMLNYDNVYADISFMISKPQILPLLRETVSAEVNPYLRKKVLYGTDFYVVRNLKSDKDIITETRFGLEEEDFDLIARTNPRKYLERVPPPKCDDYSPPNWKRKKNK